MSEHDGDGAVDTKATQAASPEPRRAERVVTDPVELIENLVHDAPAPRPARVEHAPAIVPRRRPLASASLIASVFGLSMSLFMPWAMPVSIVGTILAIIALRRTWEQRAIAWWGFGFGLAGVSYSSFWIGWILNQLAAASA